MTDKDKPEKPKRPPRNQNKKPRRKKVETEDEKVEKKIAAAIAVSLEDFAKEKNLSAKQMATINSFIEEHLSCFMLLGYTANGSPVSLINAKTQKDSDSLTTLLQKFFIKYADPPPGPGTSPFM